MNWTLYALVTPENALASTSLQQAELLPSTKPGWRWMPVVEGAPLDFQPATERLDRLFEIGETFVIHGWEAVPLTSGEQKQHSFYQGVVSGFTVQPEGFTLRLEDADRAAFGQMLALVKEALELGMITSETPQLIASHTGTRHEVTTLRFRQIMVAYGLHYKCLWDALTP